MICYERESIVRQVSVATLKAAFTLELRVPAVSTGK